MPVKMPALQASDGDGVGTGFETGLGAGTGSGIGEGDGSILGVGVGAGVGKATGIGVDDGAATLSASVTGPDQLLALSSEAAHKNAPPKFGNRVVMSRTIEDA